MYIELDGEILECRISFRMTVEMNMSKDDSVLLDFRMLEVAKCRSSGQSNCHWTHCTLDLQFALIYELIAILNY